MRIVTAAQMKQIEKNADASGLSYLQMMEHAGSAAYQIIRQEQPDMKTLVILAGKGNNGGDGFVVARLAARDGLTVHVILVEGLPVTSDAKTNYNRLADLSVTVSQLDEIDRLPAADVVIDALYGTGFHGALRPAGAKACRLMRESGAFVAALDIPSGIHADTGTVSDGAVHADLTISFDSYKYAHTADVSVPCCGKIVCADIGIPDYCHNLTE